MDAASGPVSGLAAGFVATPSEARPGAFVTFPFDRALLDGFRQTFPSARFRRKEARWFVPGKTALRRLEAWIGRELAALDAHADAKGRDAYAFEPLESPYLTVADDLVVRTPYARAVVDRLRTLPFARWDGTDKAWHIPFRAYEPLRASWAAIEEAAREAEPEARRLRRAQAAAQTSPEDRALARLFQAERRRRRLAVPLRDPPPLGEPVGTGFGVVVIEALDADPIPDGAGGDLALLRPGIAAAGPLLWAWWRIPLWREIRSLAGAGEPDAAARVRGWWPATAPEIEERRRRLREGFRARATRSGASA